MLARFISSFSEQARQAGITCLQYYVEQVEEQRLQVYEQELERLQLADVTLVYVEGEYKGQLGSTFIENPDPELFAEHIANIKQMAECNNTSFTPLPFHRVSEPLAQTDDLPTSLLVEKLKAAEQAAYAQDQRVKHVSECSFLSKKKRILLLDDQGNRMEDCLQYYRVGMAVVAQAGQQVQTARLAKLARNINELDMTGLAEAAAGRALSMLNAAPVETGNYPVIFHNQVVCQLLLTFLPAFFADRVQNSMSRMGGQLGQQVANAKLSLVEDPDFDLGIITRRFDDEGSPTSKKAIIADGILKSYLHNRRTAEKAGVVSTGNGFKRDYTEKPTISPTNLYLRQGTSTLADLQKEMGTGLLITECDGMFAGANPVSGDFSLISKGYLIDGGEVVRPVAQITVAGNFFELLKQVSSIGCDYDSTGSENGFVTAPSLLIPSLAVAGE